MEALSDLAEKKVKELKTELVSVDPAAPLTRLVATLRRKNAYEAFIANGSSVSMVGIRDVLRARNVHVRKALTLATPMPKLSPENEIREAAELMTNYRVRALPIMDQGKVIGEITALSICEAMTSREMDFSVDKIMTSHPITLLTDDRLGKAKSLMNRRNLDHLPVLENSRIVRVITSRRLLDTLIPPEKPGRFSRTPEAKGVDRFSVRGLMERPLMCEVTESASAVLRDMIKRHSTYALVVSGEELQGIVTYRDFVKLLARHKATQVPIYMVGLPSDPFEAKTAQVKFTRAINLLRRSFPDILEARSVIKTRTPKGKKGRRRYEVKSFIHMPNRIFAHSESGWDLPSIFDLISDRIRKVMTRKANKR